MIKSILLSASLLFVIQSSQAQSVYDLEKFSSAGTVQSLLNGKSPFEEARHIPTTLPASSTKQLQHFSFGSVNFSPGGEAGPTDAEASKISFLYRDATKKDLAGLVIALEKTTESKLLGKYIAQHYGKATVLTKMPSPNAKGILIGYPARSYHDVKRKQTLIIADAYNLKNRKPSLSTWLFIIKDDAQAINAGTEGTVISVLKAMYTQ